MSCHKSKSTATFLSPPLLLFLCGRFRQPVPMPSYLIALAVGDLESREVGPRTRVWSEKEFVEQSAYEFAEVSSKIGGREEMEIEACIKRLEDLTLSCDT